MKKQPAFWALSVLALIWIVIVVVSIFLSSCKVEEQRPKYTPMMQDASRLIALPKKFNPFNLNRNKTH